MTEKPGENALYVVPSDYATDTVGSHINVMYVQALLW